MVDDNFLKITEDTVYGKFLGGCCYAGFPIDKIITISLNEQIFIQLFGIMFVTEDFTSYEVAFSWELSDIEECAFRYSRDDLKKLSSAKIDWDQEDFLSVGLNTHIQSDRHILSVNTVNTYITEQNKKQVYDFLANFKHVFDNFFLQADSLYTKHKEINDSFFH